MLYSAEVSDTFSRRRPGVAAPLIAAALACLASCGGSKSTPTAPSTPPAVHFTVSGTVFNALLGSTSGVAAATVQITTGPNTGRSVTTDSSGRYQLVDLVGGNMTVKLAAANYEALSRDIVITTSGTIDFALSPTIVTTSGRIVDAVSQAALGGVTISGGSVSVQSDAGGAFMVTGAPGSITSPLLLTFARPTTIARQTSLRVPGKDALVSLIPSSFDLAAFDQMFRMPMLERWTTVPPLKIETRTGQFTDIHSTTITTIGDSMSDVEYASVVSDLTTGLGALSGDTFTAFESIARQDSPQGTTVNVLEDDVITVMRVRGMENAIGAVGLGSALLLTDGTVVGGMVLLDRDYDQNRSGFGQQVRQHELGHAMGYSHVTSRDSVMNPVTGPRAIINAADRLAAHVAFERPPGNRTPDVDPDAFTANPAGRRLVVKGPERMLAADLFPAPGLARSSQDLAPPGEVLMPGWSVTMPKVSKQVLPQHPEAAGSGAIDLEVIVGTDGSVVHVRVANSADSIPALAQAALDAIRQWKFKPAVTNGHKVGALVLVRMQFAESRTPGKPGAVSATVGKLPDRDDVIDARQPVPAALPARSPGAQPAMLLRRVEPAYTPAAMRARIQGDVEMDIVILADGTVGSARILKSLDPTLGLDQEALVTASHWLFRPVTVNGQPVAAHASLILSFRLH